MTSCFKEGNVKVGFLKGEGLHQDGRKGGEVLEHRGVGRAPLRTGGPSGWEGKNGRTGTHSVQTDGGLPVLALQPQASSLTLENV